MLAIFVELAILAAILFGQKRSVRVAIGLGGICRSSSSAC